MKWYFLQFFFFKILNQYLAIQPTKNWTIQQHPMWSVLEWWCWHRPLNRNRTHQANPLRVKSKKLAGPLRLHFFKREKKKNFRFFSIIDFVALDIIFFQNDFAHSSGVAIDQRHDFETNVERRCAQRHAGARAAHFVATVVLGVL